MGHIVKYYKNENINEKHKISCFKYIFNKTGHYVALHSQEINYKLYSKKIIKNDYNEKNYYFKTNR